MAAKKHITRIVHRVNLQDPATWLEPGQPLIGVDGRDWSWCFILFGEIDRYPGYWVDTSGYAWSRKRHGIWFRLTVNLRAGGRYQVQFWRDGKNHTKLIHRLVLETFWKPCPPGMEGCHNDGNPENNRFVNLRWDTDQSNQLDRIRHGTSNRGSRNGRVKLTEEQAMDAFRRRQSGEPRYLVARSFGVDRATIYDIERGKSWAHVTGVAAEKRRERVGGVSVYIAN